MTDEAEIGRELLASDLKPRMVVVVVPSWEWETAMTLWVLSVAGGRVEFFSGKLGMRVAAHISDQDTLVTEGGRQILVFEYLGVV